MYGKKASKEVIGKERALRSSDAGAGERERESVCSGEFINMDES